MIDTTRQFCQRCHTVMAVDFWVPKPMWKRVALKWQDSILCIVCFAALGDEKHIEWEKDIKFQPVSYATLHGRRRQAA